MTKEATEKKEEGIVKVPQTQIDNLLKRLDSLEKDKDMLLQVADKRQLGIYYSRHQGKIPGRVFLRVYDGKVILGWRSTKDVVQPDPILPGRWIEDQRTELLFEDGTTSGEIPLVQFTRNYKQVVAEVKQKITNEETGALALKVVRLDNGKEYTIDVTFVN
jgi:hypothetical protein